MKKVTMVYPENTDKEIDQILVVFDASGCSRLSLQTVTNLASGLNANVRGLYIEDINLLHAANLSFTREIALHTARVREINANSIIRNLRTYAGNIKLLFEEYMELAQVASSFNTIRGEKIPTIIKEAVDTQLVFFPAIHSLILGYTNNKTAHAHKNVMALFYDPSASAARILKIAVSMAIRDDLQLLVLVRDAVSAGDARKQIQQHACKTTYQIIDEPDVTGLFNLIKKHSPRILIMPQTSDFLHNTDYLQHVVDKLDCDVILVR